MICSSNQSGELLLQNYELEKHRSSQPHTVSRCVNVHAIKYSSAFHFHFYADQNACRYLLLVVARGDLLLSLQPLLLQFLLVTLIFLLHDKRQAARSKAVQSDGPHAHSLIHTQTTYILQLYHFNIILSSPTSYLTTLKVDKPVEEKLAKGWKSGWHIIKSGRVSNRD